NGFKLASEGSEYLLARKVDPSSAPPSPSQSPGQPARDVPDVPAPAGVVAPAGGSIVGSWRNATGSAQFNADGTGVVDGQPGRYLIRGNQLTLIGAQGQIVVQFA